MSFGRILLAIVAMFVIAGLVYSGVWHYATRFVWQYPMLSWLPLLAVLVVGFAVGTIRYLTHAGEEGAPARPKLALGPGLLAGIALFLVALFFVLFAEPTQSLEDFEYEVVETLPQQSQPRLLPRAGVDDDQAFRDAKETHLLRDPKSGELLWTGEWHGSVLGSESDGVSIRALDDVINESVIQRTGFDHSVAGVTPSTMKGKARLDHPFSGIQYPVVVPNGKDEAFAMAPYVGYSGFPFRHPYLKGVLVYHQDGTLEDLTPEEANERPELVRTGRIVPEVVARSEAEAIAASPEVDGEIHDAKGNDQPFLTSIDATKTVWVTTVDSSERDGGVAAIVLTDSSTGDTEVWEPPADRPLISTEEVIDQAEALPLRWEEERCCDSDGNSYTVTLREVAEPRLAFKDGKPYYLVTVVPTDELALSREVEYTLLIDGETGEELDRFDHVSGGLKEDVRLQAFFESRGGS